MEISRTSLILFYPTTNWLARLARSLLLLVSHLNRRSKLQLDAGHPTPPTQMMIGRSLGMIWRPMQKFPGTKVVGEEVGPPWIQFQKNLVQKTRPRIILGSSEGFHCQEFGIRDHGITRPRQDRQGVARVVGGLRSNTNLLEIERSNRSTCTSLEISEGVVRIAAVYVCIEV